MSEMLFLFVLKVIMKITPLFLSLAMAGMCSQAMASAIDQNSYANLDEFGVMTRAAPQLNIFSLGFAFALLVGLLLCWYILGSLYSHYELFWLQSEQQICRLIRLDC